MSSGGPAGLLQIYFDGLCPLCSREINLYRRRVARGGTHASVEFVDIMASGFDASLFGLDPDKVRKLFHVKTPEGVIVSGVAAFAEIWKVIPGFEIPLWLAEHRPSRALMELGYLVFAKLRPFLPRKKECETGQCKF